MTCRNGTHYRCDKCTKEQRECCLEYIPTKNEVSNSIEEAWRIFRRKGSLPSNGSIYFDLRYCQDSVPIRVEWNEKRNTLSIDGKEVDVIYSPKFSFKANRNGILTCDSPKEFVKEMVRCRVEDIAGLDDFYYRALTYAKGVCKQTTKEK